MCKVVKHIKTTYNIMMKMKKKKKNKLPTICMYIIIFSVIFSLIFINYFNKKLGPNLIKCAEDVTERITSLVTSNCVDKYLKSTNKYNINNLITIARNNNQIERISYNTTLVNKITMDITNNLEKDINYMMKGDFEKINLDLDIISDNYYEKIKDGILFTVSMGSATGNSLLANIGPKIPLNLSTIGNIKVDVESKITEYGLNNAYLDIYLNIKVNTIIQMPFLSKKVTTINKIPLTMELIQGAIPNYYLTNTN